MKIPLQAAVAVIAATTAIDWNHVIDDATKILVALIGLGVVYLGVKVRQVHLLVNSQLDKVMTRLDAAVDARTEAVEQKDIATGERDEARRSEKDGS